MKKLFCLILGWLILASGGAFAETVDYVGHWLLTKAEVSGMRVDPALAGLHSTMTFYEDGRYLLIMADESQNGTWVVRDSGVDLISGSAVVSFAVVDGALVLDLEGDKMIYTREAAPQPLAGLTVADFNGDWVCSFLTVDGSTYDADVLGADLVLNLADGKGHVKMGSYAGVEEFDAICTVKESETYGTVMHVDFLVNGKLCGDGMVLFIYDDGTLIWFDSYDGLRMFYCFKRMDKILMKNGRN